MGTKKYSVHLSSVLLMAVLTAMLIPCILSSVFTVYINSNARTMLYWGTVAVFVLLAVQQKHKLFLSRGSMNWLLMWLAIWAVSIFRNGDIERGSYGSVMTMLAIIIITAILSASGRPLYKLIFMAMKILLVIQLIAGTYFFAFPEQLARLGGSFYHLGGVWLSKFNQFVGSHYFMGLVTHYSTSGIYMATATILMFAESVESIFVSGEVKKRDLILFILFSVALILTQKRAHLLFSGAACIAMYLVGYVNGNLSKKLRQVLIGILSVVLIVVFIINVPSLSGVATRFLMGVSVDMTSDGRFGLWKPAWNFFIKNLWLGIGWGRFKWLCPQLQGSFTINNNVHNIYLQLLCENGIIFGSLIIIFLLYTYVLTWKKLLNYKKAGPQVTEYLPMLFSFGYQTFFLLYGLTGNPLYDIETLYPYMICSSISFRYAFRPSVNLQRSSGMI